MTAVVGTHIPVPAALVHGPGFELVPVTRRLRRSPVGDGTEPMTTPPPEPMLLFVAVSSALYTMVWRLLWKLSEDDGVELEYSELES